MSTAKIGPTNQGLSVAWFGVLLAICVVIIAPEVVFGPVSFFFRDFGLFGYPLASYHREAFWRGEIPLWNPLSDCGLPFLAQWNTLVLYPGSLIYLLFPLPWSLGVFCLVHLWVGGMTMRWLAFEWTGHRLGAAVAGLVYALNGLSVNALMWPNNVAALAWAPAVVLLVERASRRGGAAVFAAALIGALQMLTGAPEFILFTWITAGAFAMAGQSSVKEFGRLAARFAIVAGLVVMISAAQLLPFLDLLRESQRDGGYGGSSWSMPANGWANLLVPLFQTFPARQGVHFQAAQQWTSSYYLGAVTILLAVVAIWRVRGGRVVVAFTVAAAGLVLAMGSNGVIYGWVQRAIPAFGLMRYPIKFVFLAVLTLPLLAAWGLQWGMERDRFEVSKVRWTTWVVGGLGLALIMGLAVWSFVFPASGESTRLTVWNATIRAALGFGFLGALAVTARSEPSTGQKVMLGQVIVLGLLAGDLLTHAPRQNPTVNRAVLVPRLDVWQKTEPLPRHGMSRALVTPQADERLRLTATSNPLNDYLCNRLGLFSNLNLLEGIPKVNGFYSLYLRESSQVVDAIYASASPIKPLYDFLGVAQITRPGEYFEWTNRPSFMPLVTTGQRPEFVEPNESLARLLDPQFEPRSQVFLSVGDRAAVTATNRIDARITRTDFAAGRVRIEISAPAPAMVSIAEAFHHGWQATVDGQPVPLWRANHAFQALEVPSGQHVIVVRYVDREFQLGAILTGLGLVICVAGYVALRRNELEFPIACPGPRI